MILIIRVNLMLQWVWPSVALLLLLLLLLFCTTGIRKRAALLVPQIMLWYRVNLLSRQPHRKCRRLTALLSSSDGRLFKDGCVEASEAKAICAAVAVVLCEAREALICGLRGELSGRIWFG
jgi:hypothetical protein